MGHPWGSRECQWGGPGVKSTGHGRGRCRVGDTGGDSREREVSRDARVGGAVSVGVLTWKVR